MKNKEKLIQHIRKINRQLGILEVYATLNHVTERQEYYGTVATRNYLNGLLCAYELIFENSEELKELESSLVQRRHRIKKLMTYLRKIYLEKELAKKSGGVK